MSEVTVRGQDAYTPIPAEARIPRLWQLPLLLIGLALAVGVVIIVVTLAIGAGGFDPTALQSDWRAVVLFANTIILALTALVALWIRFGERRPLASAGVRSRRPGAELLWVFAGMLFGALITEVIARATGSDDSLAGLLRQLGAAPDRVLVAFGVIFLVMLPNSMAEELIFRGWGLSVIGRRLNLVWAIAITSTLFGMVHVQPWQWADPARLLSFVSYAGAGVVFCALALRTGGLLAPIAFHTGFNALLLTGAFADLGLRPERLMEQFTTTPLGTETLAQAVVWLIAQWAFAGALFWWWRRGPRAAPAAEET
jgi:uncharacterized protein